jgi:hypothetical protein
MYFFGVKMHILMSCYTLIYSFFPLYNLVLVLSKLLPGGIIYIHVTAFTNYLLCNWLENFYYKHQLHIMIPGVISIHTSSQIDRLSLSLGVPSEIRRKKNL